MPPICTWKQDEDGLWNTGCDNAFFFDTGGVADNEFKYCPYCGNKIRAKPFAEAPDAP